MHCLKVSSHKDNEKIFPEKIISSINTYVSRHGLFFTKLDCQSNSKPGPLDW
jgi:hypothetical protein